MAEPERSWDDHEVVELQEDYEDEIAGLRARLTTAETERDQANACIDALEEAMFDVATFDRETGALIGRSRDDLETRVESLRAAEARAEAAERAIEKGRWAYEMLRHHRGNEKATLAWAETFLREGADIFLARAALACPPQRETMTADEYAHFIRTGERGTKHLPTTEDHRKAIQTLVEDGTLAEFHLRLFDACPPQQRGE